VIPDTTDPSVNYATCAVSDISYGCEGIDPRQVKYLRIAEPIGWPYDNQLGGQRYGEKGPRLINWTPIRILGDVPVESDGSAHFRLPTDTAVYFQLLDENRLELRRMRSFISFQPGEQRACVGCHETRAAAPVPNLGPKTLALQRPPSSFIPPPWGDRPVSFLRDIQPILDRHCVSCHSGLKPAGKLDFFGGLTDWSREVEKFWGRVPGYGFNRAFETINNAGLVAIAEPNIQDATITPPRAYGAHRSKLLAALDDAQHGGQVKLAADERLRLVMWMDANAPYHDCFVNKRTDRPAYDLAGDEALLKKLGQIHSRRCSSCHKTNEVTRLDWIDLHQPRQSLFLRAPLSRQAGGLGKCGQAVYSNTADADYRSVLDLVQEAVKKAWANPRRDLKGLVMIGK
jgi:mono/diheme cytochrome c family protein